MFWHGEVWIVTHGFKLSTRTLPAAPFYKERPDFIELCPCELGWSSLRARNAVGMIPGRRQPERPESLGGVPPSFPLVDRICILTFRDSDTRFLNLKWYLEVGKDFHRVRCIVNLDLQAQFLACLRSGHHTAAGQHMTVSHFHEMHHTTTVSTSPTHEFHCVSTPP